MSSTLPGWRNCDNGRVCASDWFRRQGDLLTESEDPERARVFLETSAHVLGSELDDDTRGRILFVRGIAWFFLGHRDHALDDAGATLALLSLTHREPTREGADDPIPVRRCAIATWPRRAVSR